MVHIDMGDLQFTFSLLNILNFKRITYMYDYKRRINNICLCIVYLKVDVHVLIYYGNITYTDILCIYAEMC